MVPDADENAINPRVMPQEQIFLSGQILIEDYLNRKYGQASVNCDGDASQISLRDRSTPLHNIYFENSSYRGEYSVVVKPEVEKLFFTFPRTGSFVFKNGAVSYGGGFGAPVSFLSRGTCKFEVMDGLSQCAVVIDRRVITDRLAEIEGRDVSQMVSFSPDPSLSQPLIERMFGVVSHVSEIYAKHPYPPQIQKSGQNLVLDMLLHLWPNDSQQKYEHISPGLSPRQIRKALEIIHSDPISMLTSSELAELCSVSLRSLQYSFKEFLGCGIAEYRSTLRLRGALQDLQKPQSGSVAEIAARWGFSSPANFSRAFKREFGLKPSDIR